MGLEKRCTGGFLGTAVGKTTSELGIRGGQSNGLQLKQGQLLPSENGTEAVRNAWCGDEEPHRPLNHHLQQS